MLDRPVQLLSPPYRELTALPPDDATPPGTVVLTPLTIDLEVMERTLRGIARRVPWAAVAVLTTRDARNQLDIAMRSMRELTGAHATLVTPAAGTHPLVVEILDAVARRAPPTAEQLADWAARRLGRPDLVDDLALAMRPPHLAPALRDDRGLRRRLSREGLPSPLALARLRIIAGAYRQDQPLTEAGVGLGLTPRQLRTWLQRLARCPVERWIRQPGWEWVIEETLRIHARRATRVPLPPPQGPGEADETDWEEVPSAAEA